MSSNDSLQLRYAFISNPQFIRASADGSHTNTVNLRVLLSNPTTSAITLKQITITIPTGEESSRSLSDDSDLPAPVQTGTDWQVSGKGSNITIKPTPPSASGTIAGQPIEFTLPNIRVNQTPGVVPITITELPASGPKRIDGNSYQLEKQDADFPVAGFYADPATLYDLDQSVTLYWQVTAPGQQYAYNVHSDSWRPKSCLDGGDCYTWQDGTQGVLTAPLTQTTTFALDVIRTDATGHRSIYKTLYITVPLQLPTISPASHASSLLFGGFVVLYWLAINAESCALKLNDAIVDSLAPTDTYQQGYPVTLLGGGTLHQFQLIAYAPVGTAQETFSFPLIQTAPTCHIAHNLATSAMAVTRDGKLALVAGFPWDKPPAEAAGVWVFNLEQGQMEPASIPAGKIPNGVAITPDGAHAYVTDRFGSKVTIIDVAQRQAEPAIIALPTVPSCIAITPDGQLALIGSGSDSQVLVLNIAKRQVETSPITVSADPKTIAVSPDGKSALVGLVDGSVAKIDIGARKAEPIAGWNIKGLTGIAITPDGANVLVLDDHNAVTVLNLTGQPGNAQSFKSPGRAIFVLVTMPDSRIAISGGMFPNYFVEVI